MLHLVGVKARVRSIVNKNVLWERRIQIWVRGRVNIRVWARVRVSDHTAWTHSMPIKTMVATRVQAGSRVTT